MKAEEKKEGYQGWANYETWAVALWIDNEESTHRKRGNMVKAAMTLAPKHENVDNGIWTVEQTERYTLADAVKGWVSDSMMPNLGASLAADLLGAALSEVDWDEIAETWLSHAKEDA